MIGENDFSMLYPPRPGRTHEVMGPGATFFAIALGQRIGGNVLWIQEDWVQEHINPWGVSDILNPSQVLIARPKNQYDVLAAAEEALRSGAMGLVIYHLNAPLTLTAGRRLQLAADVGNTTGLAIISDGMGSNATETRWHCLPIFSETDSTLQRWEIKKNKKGTLRTWDVRWDTTSRTIAVVSPTGNRSGS